MPYSPAQTLQVAPRPAPATDTPLNTTLLQLTLALGNGSIGSAPRLAVTLPIEASVFPPDARAKSAPRHLTPQLGAFSFQFIDVWPFRNAA